MTTAADAYALLRARLVANKPAALTAFRFQNEDADSAGNVTLPDVPAAFAYVEFTASSGRPPIAFGGGAGANLYRNIATLDVWVFVPAGAGLAAALELAEACAAILRSYRSGDVSCFDATVHPGGAGADLKPAGLASEVGNYFWSVAEVSLFYDQVG